jgi:hypothetical protein
MNQRWRMNDVLPTILVFARMAGREPGKTADEKIANPGEMDKLPLSSGSLAAFKKRPRAAWNKRRSNIQITPIMSVKYLLPLVASLGLFSAHGAPADHQPSGKLIELHSCEVYAGGCTVSSEAQQDGRYMLQVWDLTSGSWEGVKLSGLKVAVLESSSENLADAGTRAESTVVYLPKGASTAQHKALLAWLKSSDGHVAGSAIQTRVVPISLTRSADGVKVAVGNFASFQTVALGECENRVCGEDLWYQPSIGTSLFTVALNKGSQVNEPLLELKWNDHGKRSVFVARFGEGRTPKNLFVNASEWCGPAGRLF